MSASVSRWWSLWKSSSDCSNFLSVAESKVTSLLLGVRVGWEFLEVRGEAKCGLSSRGEGKLMD